MTTLEHDPRFKHLQLTMDKFLASGEGKLMMEFLDAATPMTVTGKGMDTAAISGAESKGWRDCMAHLRRLSIFRAPPPQMPEAEFLKSDKINPPNSP